MPANYLTGVAPPSAVPNAFGTQANPLDAFYSASGATGNKTTNKDLPDWLRKLGMKGDAYAGGMLKPQIRYGFWYKNGKINFADGTSFAAKKNKDGSYAYTDASGAAQTYSPTDDQNAYNQRYKKATAGFFGNLKESLNPLSHASPFGEAGLLGDPLHYAIGDKYDNFIRKTWEVPNKELGKYVKQFNVFDRTINPLHRAIDDTQFGQTARNIVENKPADVIGSIIGGGAIIGGLGGGAAGAAGAESGAATSGVGATGWGGAGTGGFAGASSFAPGLSVGGGNAGALAAAGGIGGGAGIGGTTAGALGGFSGVANTLGGASSAGGGMGWGDWVNLAGQLYGSYAQGQGAKDAANASAAGSAAGLAEVRRQYDQSRADQMPWLQSGTAALGRLNDPAAFTQSPGYEFVRNEGNRDRNNSFAARGGALSGNALRGITDYNQNLASQEYNNWFNQQSNLAGLGQTSAQSLGALGANSANSVSNLLGQQANARASGIEGQTNALTGGIGDFLSWYNRRGYGGG